MPIIAIVNQKGGVGKTGTAFNLAHAISREGRKVLMVALDPQGSLTETSAGRIIGLPWPLMGSDRINTCMHDIIQ